MVEFRPLLAASLTDIGSLQFPLIASPKLDGIRCLVRDGQVLSRKLLPIPNHHVRKILSSIPIDVDGEIMIEGKDFNVVQSKVMSHEGEPSFTYHVFDHIAEESYLHRLKRLTAVNLPLSVRLLEHRFITCIGELIAYEESCVARGHEGIMVRSPLGGYKFGRSTEREQILIKMKRFHDSEAVVVGFEERMHNANEAKRDELGYAKRSSKKDGLLGSNTLGSLTVRDVETGSEFSVGSGFTDEQRKHIWYNLDEYLGRTLTYKYQEISKYGVPRFPVFKGWRLD